MDFQSFVHPLMAFALAESVVVGTCDEEFIYDVDILLLLLFVDARGLLVVDVRVERLIPFVCFGFGWRSTNWVLTDIVCVRHLVHLKLSVQILSVGPHLVYPRRANLLQLIKQLVFLETLLNSIIQLHEVLELVGVLEPLPVYLRFGCILLE